MRSPWALSANANAGRHGVLVKIAIVMEQVAQTTRVALNKICIPTQGTPHLTDVLTLADLREDEVLRLASSAEPSSEHPLGAAVVTAATPGRGIHAVMDGRHARVGSPPS